MGIVRTLLLCCALLALYAAFAGSLGMHEIVAGIGCVALLGVLVSVLHRGQRRRLDVRPPPAMILRTVLLLVADTLRVGRVLFGAVLRRPDGALGRIGSIAFRHGDNHPRAAGRRAAATLAASLAPNGFVLALPRDRDAMLLHRLAPAPDPSDRDWPV